MHRLILSLCTALILAGVAHAQTPLGTAFTYQGRLTNAGGPATGSFHMDFKLYDAADGGAQVGPTVTQSVSVVDGLFSAVLDFGAVLDGNQRWVEVTVEGATLSPRQELTATPYARFAAAPWATSGSNIF